MRGYTVRKVPQAGRGKNIIGEDGSIRTHGFYIESDGSMAWAIWKLWCKITRRSEHDVRNPKIETLKRIQESLGEWDSAPTSDIEKVVRAASYLSPYGDVFQYTSANDEDSEEFDEEDFAEDEEDSSGFWDSFINGNSVDEEESDSSVDGSKPDETQEDSDDEDYDDEDYDDYYYGSRGVVNNKKFYISGYSDREEEIGLFSPDHLYNQSAYEAKSKYDETEDPDDIMRLCLVFDSPDHRELAIKLSEEYMSEPVAFSDRKTFPQKMSAICKMFKVDDFERLEHLDKNAIAIVAMMDDLNFKNCMEILGRLDVVDRNGNTYFDSHSPAEILDMIKKNSIVYPQGVDEDTLAENSVIEKNPSRNKESGYGRGRREDTIINTEEMEVDIAASGMIDEGYPIREALKFHNQAPKGYWKRVVQIVNRKSSSGDPEEAYTLLRSEFDFHPDTRVMPKLR